MRKKLFTTILITLLCSVGITQPSAMAEDLTDFASFTNSANYKELSELLDRNRDFINYSDGTQISITTTSNYCALLGGCKGPSVIKKSGNTSYVNIQTAIGPITSITVNKVNYISLGYACSQYYPKNWVDAFGTGCGGADTIKRVKKYLKNPSVKYVAFPCSADSSGTSCVDEKYLKVISGDQSLSGAPGLMSLGSYADIDGLLIKLLSTLDPSFLNYERTGINQSAFFSDVTKSDSQNLVGGTDYSFSVMVWAGRGDALDSTDLTFSFDGEGKLVKTVLSYNGLIGLTKTYDYQIGQSMEIKAPAASLVTSRAKFWNANHSFMATAELLRMTGSLNIAAKQIAKRAKRTINYTDVISAVKSKGLTYQKLKSTVVVRKKYRGVAGSMCLSLVRGNVIGKEC